MKRIDDIEKMNLEELEQVSVDGPAEVPGGFEEKIRNGLLAAAADEELRKEKRPVRRIVSFSALVSGLAVAACLLVWFAFPDQPKDTFDDPRMAYAELERTLSYVSAKMEQGVSKVTVVENVMDKTSNILNSTVILSDQRESKGLVHRIKN